MIEIQAKIHDRFSVEFKIGFVVRRKLKENNFMMNTWIFIPNSLDINPVTYSKEEFYRDVKSNIRLITPIFLLRDIAAGNAIPLHHLEDAFSRMASAPTRTAIAEYEYNIKMFTAIFKSSLRNELFHIVSNTREDDVDYLCNAYIDNITGIMTRYRDLRRIINVPTVSPEVLDYFQFGDEFMSNIMQMHTLRLIRWLDSVPGAHRGSIIERLSQLVRAEDVYKHSVNYLSVDRTNDVNNRDLIFRHGVLKKYVESDLFLSARRKKDGLLVEQIYYSIAAGMSMVFATVVAFSFQMKYGNLTMPFFVALVVSYMLKDRIKELMRFYFAHRLKAKYFDNKTTISIKDTEIGWSKEGFDFITDDKAPRDVMEIRSRSALLQAENRVSDEKIILYRKLVFLDREKLEEGNQYTIAGINDIMRLHLTNFMQKMDNPEVPINMLDDQGNVITVEGQKIYYINMVMQFQFEQETYYKRYRLIVSRDGINEIEELK